MELLLFKVIILTIAAFAFTLGPGLPLAKLEKLEFRKKAQKPLLVPPLSKGIGWWVEVLGPWEEQLGGTLSFSTGSCF